MDNRLLNICVSGEALSHKVDHILQSVQVGPIAEYAKHILTYLLKMLTLHLTKELQPTYHPTFSLLGLSW